MDTLIGKHWHHLPAEEVIDLLGGNPEKGLDAFKVKHLKEHFGPKVVGQTESAGKSRQRVRGESPRMVKISDQLWPRVMRRLSVRWRRSVDRGRAGMAIELRNHLIRIADLEVCAYL